ncbi:MAG: hypothetical protein PHO37_11220 [Kiritimatiellae bacterium]|nr:hypothetical protein [Kiritimatiellia bacterium]
MKITKFKTIGVVATVIAVAVAGCGRNPEDEGVGERTGAALDSAAESTADAAKTTGKKIKEVTGQAVEKTGEVIEKAGAAVEKAGDGMQK